MENQRFYKRERLCSKIDIDRLFPLVGASGRRASATPKGKAEEPSAVMAYPWRAIWLPNRHGLNIDFPRLLIMVPKRRLRHAVDRAVMRRRLREAWRLNRADILGRTPLGVDIALIYVTDKTTPLRASERSLKKIFDKIIIQTNQISAVAQDPCSKNEED